MNRFGLSIATKLILATLVLLLAVTIPLAHQSYKYFESESKKKEEEINLNHSMARATETGNIFQSLLEKSRSVGTLYLMHQKTGAADLLESIETLLENDRDIFAVDIYRSQGGEFTLEKSLVKEKRAGQMSANESQLERIRQKSPFPVSSVARDQIEITPALNETGTPLMAIGLPISRNELGQIDAITVTYFKLARLQRAFSRDSERTIFLVDARGQVLAHPDENLVLTGQNLQRHPVVARALVGGDPRGKMSFVDGSRKRFRAAYVRTSMGPIVISQISDDYILRPAMAARRQSFLIAGIVLSLSLFVVFLLSLNFSTPIEKLAGLLREVSRGNLDVSAKEKITSHDEVGELAHAFEEMVGGLRERAKAYSVMRQALGASVVQTLMTMKDEELGGQRKPVTVLFSDLRDFTRISEGASPEEVVIMLNEYFDAMVKIIAKHGGWLDKFIGDAIMAVWGVPYTGENDAIRAVHAAIDMRIALLELNESRAARGQTPIRIGIGLHCGDAIVGKIGATERANLTVVGDTVNAASRIESSTKIFGTDILLSEKMAAVVKDVILLEPAGSAEIKGKTGTMRLFRVRGYRDRQGRPVEIRTPYSEFTPENTEKVKIA